MKGAKTWEEMRAELPLDMQEEITARSTALIKELRLARIRETAMKKQSEVDGMTQDAVSRLENRKDWLVSSINTYVRGMGGTLKLVAELPGVGTVELPVTSRGRLATKTQAPETKAKSQPRRRKAS